jgi:hypothetical protein
MKNIIKKICSLLALIMIILNSSVLTTLSMAIDEISTNVTANVSNDKKEKVKIYTSYTRLTNRLPNELTITGILEKDTEDCALYENPVVYFEFPAEIEKVVVNDIKVLYDNELKLKDYTIEKNDAGNQVIKVSLEGKQTQYSTDGISQGTNIRIVANVIAKQDIKTGYENLTMVCNTATAAQGLLIVNATENAILNNVEPKKENGTIIYANGLMLNTRSSIGSNTLKDGDTIHSNEIINNQIMGNAGNPCLKLAIFHITSLLNSHHSFHKRFLEYIISHILIVYNKKDIRKNLLFISLQQDVKSTIITSGIQFNQHFVSQICKTLHPSLFYS